MAASLGDREGRGPSPRECNVAVADGAAGLERRPSVSKTRPRARRLPWRKAGRRGWGLVRVIPPGAYPRNHYSGCSRRERVDFAGPFPRTAA